MINTCVFCVFNAFDIVYWMFKFICVFSTLHVSLTRAFFHSLFAAVFGVQKCLWPDCSPDRKLSASNVAARDTLPTAVQRFRSNKEPDLWAKAAEKPGNPRDSDYNTKLPTFYSLFLTSGTETNRIFSNNLIPKA